MDILSKWGLKISMVYYWGLIYPLPQHSHLNQATAAHSTTEYIYLCFINHYDTCIWSITANHNGSMPRYFFYLTSTLNCCCCCCCFFKLIDLVEKCVSFVMKLIVQYMLEVLSNHLFRMITANVLDYPYLWSRPPLSC